MNRRDLIATIAKNTKTSKAATTRFLDDFIILVQDEVAKGGVVKLAGFGVFEKTTIAARIGRNPKTGAPIKVPLTHRPKFTPGSAFKVLVKTPR